MASADGTTTREVEIVVAVEVVVSRPVAAPTPAGDTLTAAEGLLGSRSAGRSFL